MNPLLSFSTRRLAAPALAASIVLRTSTSTRAEEATDEKDPYANLPEEDERTTCTICLVNRQGPCRQLWRKFERCLKDHSPKDKEQDGEGKSNDLLPEKEHTSTFCDQYMLQWLTCVQEYRNMYTLYFNYMNQLEFIEPLEKEIRVDEVRKWKDANPDWTPYVDWLKSKGYSLWELYWRLKQTAPPITPRPKFEGEDPEMVDIELRVKLEEDGLPIQVAYAKDQGGLVLGMELFGTAKEENLEEGTLKVSFRPALTSSLQFFAVYKKDDGDEARFLCSAPESLAMVAMEAGIPEGEFSPS